MCHCQGVSSRKPTSIAVFTDTFSYAENGPLCKVTKAAELTGRRHKPVTKRREAPSSRVVALLRRAGLEQVLKADRDRYSEGMLQVPTR